MIFRFLLLVLILGFIAAGIYSYLDPSGSERLWRPARDFVRQFEQIPAYTHGTSAKEATQKEVDALGFGPKPTPSR